MRTVSSQTADRQLRAYEQSGDYLVLDTNRPGLFRVQGPRATYLTTADTCDCPDHRNRGIVCKHSHLVRFTLQMENEQPRPKPAPAPRVSRISAEQFAADWPE